MRPSVLFVLLALAACASGPVAFEVPDARVLPAIDPEPLPTAFRDALGFDVPVPMTEPDAIQVGDRVLYRIWFEDDGESSEWFALAELRGRAPGTATLSGTIEGHGAFEHRSPVWSCAVLVFDAASDQLTAAELLVPEVSMFTNLYSMAMASSEIESLGEDAVLTREDFEPLLIGASSAVMMFNGWRENESLAPLLKRVVGTPALAILRSAFTLDFGYTLHLGHEGITPDRAAVGDTEATVPSYRMPATITLAGETLLQLELEAVECVAPLSIGMGIVGVRGFHPTSSERWVEIEMVGARRAR